MKQGAVPCAECPFVTDGVTVVSDDGRETYNVTMSPEDSSLAVIGTGECGSSARIINVEEIEERTPEMLEAIRACRGPIQEDLAFVRRSGLLGKVGLCKLRLLPTECGAMTHTKMKQFLEQSIINQVAHSHDSKNSNCKCT